MQMMFSDVTVLNCSYLIFFLSLRM